MPAIIRNRPRLEAGAGWVIHVPLRIFHEIHLNAARLLPLPPPPSIQSRLTGEKKEEADGAREGQITKGDDDAAMNSGGRGGERINCRTRWMKTVDRIIAGGGGIPYVYAILAGPYPT